MKSGWVILDKESGVNSRKVGNEIRKMFGAESFGHIGTLDPMASGVLPIALGEATKMIPYMPGGNKIYEFSVIFGIKTDTDDITGNVIMEDDGGRISRLPKPNKGLGSHKGKRKSARQDTPGITRKDIEKVLPKFLGKIMQIPPAYSAVHVNGVRAYKLARAGKTVEIPPREVEIKNVKCKMADGKRAEFIVECSSGTYVRSLGRDIAAALGTVGTVDTIRRVQTNGFSLDDTIKLEKLKVLVDNGQNESNGFRQSEIPAFAGMTRKGLKPIDFGLDGIPVWNLDSKETDLFRNGGFVRINAGNVKNPCIFRIYNDNQFVGIGEAREGFIRPKRLVKV